MTAATVMPMNRRSIAIAAKAALAGGLVVFPTDTVYGLGCNPRDPSAVDRLCRIKNRESKPIPLLCKDFETAASMVVLSDVAARFARKYWPGALTIVATSRAEFPAPIQRGSAMLGVRVPNHRLCLQLLGDVGGVLTGTSANLSGEPASRSASEALVQLGSGVDIILDGGHLTGRESTVVGFDGDRIHVLREGSVRVPDAVLSK